MWCNYGGAKDSPCACEHNNQDSLNARLFPSVMLAVAPTVTMYEASSLSVAKGCDHSLPVYIYKYIYEIYKCIYLYPPRPPAAAPVATEEEASSHDNELL